jgi:O-antigen ligase
MRRPKPPAVPVSSGSGLAPTASFGLDASAPLMLYILALMLIPANLVVPALGATGTPAILIGLCALLWWVVAEISRSTITAAPRQPVRWATLGFILCVLVSYVVATSRPIDGIELNSADRSLLLVASWAGLIFLTSDGLTTAEKVARPLRVLSVLGGVVAVVGILQFATGWQITNLIQIPGLTTNQSLNSVYGRDGFNRAAGTATHPIEFGVVLTMILPLALHFAFTDRHRSLLMRWWPVAAITFAIPITVSRSAIIGVVVALAIVMPLWSKQRRRVAYVAIAAVIGIVFVAIPGMLGTLTHLFTGISNDSSAASRTGSYDLAFEFIARAPFFGRGLGTWLPEYRILDNQYLGLLIEVGVVGTLAVLGVFVISIATAFAARKRTPDPTLRSLAQALAALVAAGACSFATFDAFGFPQVSGVVFFGIGAIGALSNALKSGRARSRARR